MNISTFDRHLDSTDMLLVRIYSSGIDCSLSQAHLINIVLVHFLEFIVFVIVFIWFCSKYCSVYKDNTIIHSIIFTCVYLLYTIP